MGLALGCCAGLLLAVNSYAVRKFVCEKQQTVKDGIEKRLNESLETALKLADGLVVIETAGGGSETYSTKYSCPDCGRSIEEIEPRLFSFSNPFGACPECHGLGYKAEISLMRENYK